MRSSYDSRALYCVHQSAPGPGGARLGLCVRKPGPARWSHKATLGIFLPAAPESLVSKAVSGAMAGPRHRAGVTKGF